MSKLKIGFVFDDSLDKPDGVQQYVLGVGEWLRRQGHDVHYLVSTTRRTDVANIHTLSRNIGVRYNGNRLAIPLPASRRKIRRLLDSEHFDVLHIQVPYSPLLAQRIIRAAPPTTAVIGTFHIVPNSRFVALANRLLAIWNGRSLRRFDAMVSVSAAAADFARQAYRLRSEVLPNVVDYGRFHEAKPLPRDPRKLRILFLGRLVPRKGCLTLLRAADILTKSHDLPEFEVLICGRGPLEAELKAFVRERHLESVVSFAGFISEDDKPGYLRSADVAVFPSSGGESFGIVLIEAMAAGAPVLAGDNVGYRSVLTKKPELLFAIADPAALAEKLRWLLADAAARQAIGTWGETYARRFDVGVVGQELLTIYDQALRKRRGQAIIRP